MQKPHTWSFRRDSLVRNGCAHTLALRAVCRVAGPGPVIQDGGRGGVCRDAEPSTVIQDGGRGDVCRVTVPGPVIQDGGRGDVCRDADPAL